MKKLYILLSLCTLLLVGCQNKLKGIEGKWLLNDKSFMVISKNEFYWYQSQSNLKDNYFYGDNLKILQGEEAIDAINPPNENRENLLKTHVYYLKTTYTSYKREGKDLSNELDKQPSEFAFQLSTKDKLSIVNLNTNASYTANRMDN